MGILGIWITTRSGKHKNTRVETYARSPVGEAQGLDLMLLPGHQTEPGALEGEPSQPIAASARRSRYQGPCSVPRKFVTQGNIIGYGKDCEVAEGGEATNP